MLRLSALALSALSLTACNAANYTSIYRTPSLENGHSVVLDAEQYMIVNRNGDTCVMPSPDALASASASGGILAEIAGQGSGSASAAAAESATSIGLRTQSIQLLRDTLFGLCLQAQNRQIDPFTAGILMRRYQSQLVAVLAVEQLTGAVAAGGGSTFTAASATPGDFVLGLTNASTEITQRRTEITNRLTAIDTALADPATVDPQKSALQSERANLVTEQEDLSTASDLVSEALENIEAGNSSAAGGALSRAAQFAPNVFESGDAASVQAVASAVEAIVASVVEADHAPTLCFEWLRRGQDPETPAPNPTNATLLNAYCADVLGRNATPPITQTIDTLTSVYIQAVQSGDTYAAAQILTYLQTITGLDVEALQLDGPPVGFAAPD